MGMSAREVAVELQTLHDQLAEDRPSEFDADAARKRVALKRAMAITRANAGVAASKRERFELALAGPVTAAYIADAREDGRDATMPAVMANIVDCARIMVQAMARELSPEEDA